MSVIIPPFLDVIHEDSPTLPNPPVGSRTISAFAWPAFMTIGGAEVVNTLQIDFYSPFAVDPGAVRNALEMAGGLLELHGLEYVCYILWEKEDFQVSVPVQFCLFDHCWTPPFAGDTVMVCYFYRLWIMLVDRPEVAAMALPLNARPGVRPLVLPFGAAVGICLIIVTAVTSVAGFIGVWTGQLSVSDLLDTTHDFITAPGENVRIATMWPMFMLGFALVASSIALPIITTKVIVPVGRRGSVEVGTSGGRSPTKKKKKR